MTTRLILVRHGQTAAALEGRSQGRIDNPLKNKKRTYIGGQDNIEDWDAQQMLLEGLRPAGAALHFRLQLAGADLHDCKLSGDEKSVQQDKKHHHHRLPQQACRSEGPLQCHFDISGECKQWL